MHGKAGYFASFHQRTLFNTTHGSAWWVHALTPSRRVRRSEYHARECMDASCPYLLISRGNKKIAKRDIFRLSDLNRDSGDKKVARAEARSVAKRGSLGSARRGFKPCVRASDLLTDSFALTQGSAIGVALIQGFALRCRCVLHPWLPYATPPALTCWQQTTWYRHQDGYVLGERT